jgi:hypothetical protein
MIRLRTLPLVVIPAVVLTAITLPVGSAVATPVAASVALPSVTPALDQLSKVVASVDPATTVNFSVLVKGPHDAELPALAQSVSNPASPDFRHS